VIELEFDNASQARHLAVPMSQAFSVAPRDDAADATLRLRRERFDQAPVVDGERVLGFVLTRHLVGARHVADAMTQLGSGNVVSADASIGRLMEWIIDPGFLFVLEGRDVTGLITVSDFNKQPVRGYLYLLLARLEVGLAELVRRRFPDRDDALALLPPDGQNIVRDRFEGDRSAGEEGELVAYFDFSDLIEVVRRDAELLRIVGGRSRNGWISYAGGLVQLRNDGMHPVRNAVLAKGGLVRLQDREQRLRSLIEKVDAAIDVAEIQRSLAENFGVPGYETSWHPNIRSVTVQGDTLTVRTDLDARGSEASGICSGASNYVISNDADPSLRVLEVRAADGWE
jgi:CBS domain-containing protein